MKHRLWICPDCRIVRAVAEAFYEVDKYAPQCDAHTEHWPDGEFTRSVSMLKTDTFVEVADDAKTN